MFGDSEGTELTFSSEQDDVLVYHRVEIGVLIFLVAKEAERKFVLEVENFRSFAEKCSLNVIY